MPGVTDMDFTTSTMTQFLPFPRLPPELKDKIWEEALPALDLQRFNAGVMRHPDSANGDTPEAFVFCLNPHEEYVQLTKAHVALLASCYDSRRVVKAKVKWLAINYVVDAGGGMFEVRSARVPFNPDGRLIISGMDNAFIEAAQGQDSRGVRLPSRQQPRAFMASIQCPTLMDNKHLTITLNTPFQVQSTPFSMIGWNERVFDTIAKRMTSLQTVAFINESVANSLCCPQLEEVESLHKTFQVIRHNEGDPTRTHGSDSSTMVIPWLDAYRHFRSSWHSHISSRDLIFGDE